MDTLKELKGQIKELADLIDAPNHSIPTFGQSEQSGLPHIEIIGNDYHFVVCERGSEHSRQFTKDKKELLFWIFDCVTFSMACKIESENRRENEDFRFQLFQVQEDLIAKIDTKYSIRLKTKHDKILNRK